MTSKPRILTGDTPSGRLHLGHYVGTLENRVKLQHDYDTYILLANIHAYAADYRQSDQINADVYQVFLDNLAVGIDPNIATIYLESGIPETMELYSYFLTMVRHNRAIRNPPHPRETTAPCDARFSESTETRTPKADQARTAAPRRSAIRRPRPRGRAAGCRARRPAPAQAVPWGRPN